jgi:chromosome segregation ATPase
MVSASLDSLRKAIPATSETGVVVSEAGSIVDPGQEAELKHLRDRNFRMLSELYSLREQAAGMEGQLASLSSAHQTEMTALRKQMDEIRETGDKLRTQLEMTRKSTVAPANFLDSLKQLHNQVSIAGSDLQVSEAKRVALEKELRSMETENARLQSNADSSRREIRMLRSQLLSAGAISQDTDGRIRQLEVRLQRSEGNNTELEKALSAEKKKNSDLEQNLLRKEAAWKALETENASLRKKYLEQKERADTLILASVAGKTERKSLQREVESLGSRLKSAEAANIRLQEDLSEALGSRVAAEMESVRLQKDLQQAGKESERMRKGYMAAAERADSLRILVNRLDRRNRRLDARLDSLQTEIAILNPDSRIAQSRRQLYLEQLDKLLALQKELNKKEIDLINLETRLAQRQRYLSEFEATRDAAVLLDQIGALEQQLTALETMVEGLRKSDPSSGNSDPEIIIFQGKYKLAGKEIPSYVYENQSDPAYLEERIRTWFALKGVSAVSWKPVIRFEDVVLEDITFRPLDVSFFLYQDDKGQQYVLTSFQLPDGSYLTDSDRAGMGDSVRTWIRKLFD